MLILANEIWWTNAQAGLFGGIAGSMGGVLGASIGVIVPLLANKGKGHNIVYGMFAGIITLGVVMLVIGGIALFNEQPYHVWYPGLLIGFLLTVITGSILPVVIVRYRQAEHRSMDADLLRGAQTGSRKQASFVGIACCALITVIITSGTTYGLIRAFLPLTSNTPRQTSSTTTSESTNSFVLDNGVRVRLFPYTEIGYVGIIAAYDVGFIDDPKGYPQIAHLAEHLRVTGGTTNTSANERWNQLNEIGSANAETQPHFTYYDYLVPQAQLELALQTEADRLSNLQLTQADIEREAPRAIAEATYIALQNPQYLHKFALMAAVQAWRYGETHANIVTGLEAIPIEVVESFIAENYRPDTLTLYIAGDFDTVEVRTLLDKTLGAVPPTSTPFVRRVEDWSGVSSEIVMTWDLPVSVVAAAIVPPKSARDQTIVTASFTAGMNRMQNAIEHVLKPTLGTSLQWPTGILPTCIIGTVIEKSNTEQTARAMATLLTTLPPDTELNTARQILQMQLPTLTPEIITMQAKQLVELRGIDETKAAGMIALQSVLNMAVVEMGQKSEVSVSNNTWNSVLSASLDPASAGTLIINAKTE